MSVASKSSSKATRRRFLGTVWAVAKVAALGAMGFIGLSALRSRLVAAKSAPAGQAPIRPPGALDEDAFRAACTRCFLCGEVCPVRCIQFPSRVVGAQPISESAPGHAHRDDPAPPVWKGDDTPYILPWESACILCMKCGDACPTGALVPIAETRDAIAAEVRMGVAQIDRKICLPWTRTSWCGACFTACPYREEAITVDYQNRPTIHAEHCIGCGLCVEVCPIRYKAIAVVPPFIPDSGAVRAE